MSALRIAEAPRSRPSPARPPLEMWGGVECTVNRVGNRYFTQLERSGHARRIGDLDHFAALGIRALRYPVLWERTAPHGIERARWSWPDRRLERLRALGVRPIVGLVHHGSGPRHTNLCDPSFPEGVAAFAGAVAARYPWVEDYTPINEPLTTARFSGLYGHWYPHGKDDRTFVRALLNECKAVILAMRAIRAVNPAARLIQTEDLGKTYSTPKLAYQAEFENDRRWVTFDLLCGRIDAHHPLRWYLRRAGASAAELDWFRANPCPPDVIGANYYITSQRFLDERLERYPEWTHGGNERHAYADIEAIRVVAGEVADPGDLLREAWARYGLPLAITEAHLGDIPDEQVRWLNDVWQAAQGASRDEIDIRAVTAWSLLGAFDWHTLVTREEGYYEPGVFDIRGRGIQPTPLAAMVRALANGQDYYNPALSEPGWWRRPERLLYPPVDVSTDQAFAAHATRR